jgi:hypothetical protein
MPRKSNTAVVTIGIDLGKNALHLVGLDARGGTVLRGTGAGNLFHGGRTLSTLTPGVLILFGRERVILALGTTFA